MISLEKSLEHVVIAGAAGTMGSGITLLLLQAIAQEELRNVGAVGSGRYQLIAIDTSIENLHRLRRFLKGEMKSWAEKQIIFLRRSYKNCDYLVSNEEIIAAFVEGACDNIRCATTPHEAKGGALFIEAVAEGENEKVSLLKSLRENAGEGAVCCSNTSSIPISILKEKSGWENLLGFHFYNPPVSKKIVEVVVPADVDELTIFSQQLAKILGKKIVPAGDVAGFIGNGYFIRELAFACEIVEKLAKTVSLSQAICLIDFATEKLLLRPMGVFRLADYIGIATCCSISKIMAKYLGEERLNNPFFQTLLESVSRESKGGEMKNGFFSYEKGKAVKVIDIAQKCYREVDQQESCWRKFFGEEEFDKITWKSLSKLEAPQEPIVHHFQTIFSAQNQGAVIAKEFIDNLVKIKELLLEKQVIKTEKELEIILKEGFGHLYLPEELPIAARSSP